MNYPRQSEVIEPFINKEWFDETSRERGTAVHKANNGYLRDVFIPPLPLAYQGYFNSFTSWADGMIKETLYAEGWKKIKNEWVPYGPLISYLGFTGTPDFIGILTGDDCISVVDWKTSVSIQKMWQLQVSGAYRILAEDNGYPVGRCLALRLDKAGGPAKVTEYGAKTDIIFFCDALNLWNFLHS